MNRMYISVFYNNSTEARSRQYRAEIVKLAEKDNQNQWRREELLKPQNRCVS